MIDAFSQMIFSHTSWSQVTNPSTPNERKLFISPLEIRGMLYDSKRGLLDFSWNSTSIDG
jgi:hypothetical protein